MTGFSNVDAFQQRFGLRLPILLSPMAGACPVPLSAAVADAGGMGAMGAVLSQPQDIVAWMAAFREAGASESVDSRPGARARCGCRSAPACLSCAVGTTGAGDGVRCDAGRF
ncbi:hypothetical protein [Xanthomonas oryzae]|uniref:hypothetical protein n=1 Tax=Xanthomonas oryzae TaxID=347 RepID=UPI003CCF2B71